MHSKITAYLYHHYFLKRIIKMEKSFDKNNWFGRNEIHILLPDNDSAATLTSVVLH